MNITLKQECLFSIHPPDRAGFYYPNFPTITPDMGFRVVPEPIITNRPRVKELAIRLTVGDVISITDYMVSIPLVPLLTFGAFVPIGEPWLPVTAAHFATPLLKVITT